MLEKIKKTVSEKYDIKSNRGIFLSLYDKRKQLVGSQGVLESSKALDELLSLIYNLIIGKEDIHIAVIDIVNDMKELHNKEDLESVDISTQGILVSSDSGSVGFMLPGTGGIKTVKDALKYIKKKNNITGKVHIISFSIDRTIISI